MKKTGILLALVAVLASSSAFAAGAAETFKIIHVADLAALMADPPKGLSIYDANSGSVRENEGVIPGAKLLSSAFRYEVSSELPSDKDAKLVFYCANTRCMASHEAARRAVDAGYEDVSVMADGIRGWADAGKPTAKP